MALRATFAFCPAVLARGDEPVRPPGAPGAGLCPAARRRDRSLRDLFRALRKAHLAAPRVVAVALRNLPGARGESGLGRLLDTSGRVVCGWLRIYVIEAEGSAL